MILHFEDGRNLPDKRRFEVDDDGRLISVPDDDSPRITPAPMMRIPLPERSADVPPTANELPVPEADYPLSWAEKMDLAWSLMKSLGSIIYGRATMNWKAFMTGLVTLIASILSSMGIIIPEGLQGPIISIGSIVLAYVMSDGNHRDLRTTITGLIGGVLALLAHYNIVLPPTLADLLNAVTITVLGILGRDRIVGAVSRSQSLPGAPGGLQ